MIGLRIALALPLRDVPVGDVAETPAGRGGVAEFLVEGNAGGATGGEERPVGDCQAVDELGCVVGAVCAVEHPVVEGTGGDGPSSPVVRVLVKPLQRLTGVVLRTISCRCIHVNPLLVLLECAYPPGDDVGGVGEVDVGGGRAVAHVEVGCYLCVESAHGLHLVLYQELGSGASVAEQAGLESLEDAVEACGTGSLREGLQGGLARDHPTVVPAKLVADPSQRKQIEGHHQDPEIGKPEGDPPQMHAGLAAIDFAVMGGYDPQNDEEASHDDEGEDALDEIEAPVVDAVEDVG